MADQGSRQIVEQLSIVDHHRDKARASARVWRRDARGRRGIGVADADTTSADACRAVERRTASSRSCDTVIAAGVDRLTAAFERT
jgi:hypothetical protein